MDKPNRLDAPAVGGEDWAPGPGASSPESPSSPSGSRTSTINYRILTSVRSYDEAQHYVDTLSDSGFPVENIRIVGTGLETVEQVTGRRTTWTATWQSGLYGAWMGVFVGLLIALFLPVIAWRVLTSALALGLIFGAISGAFGHSLQGGRRDFSSIERTRASTYEIHVVAGLVDEASRVLRLGH